NAFVVRYIELDPHRDAGVASKAFEVHAPVERLAVRIGRILRLNCCSVEVELDPRRRCYALANSLKLFPKRIPRVEPIRREVEVVGESCVREVQLSQTVPTLENEVPT